ncbi:ferredoxin-type protein NapF [Corallincola platygyrae]|uniref:Ferredoxin-type protein NapF n=1 Tax=Corallincola platygyrae TaxID=1193278 RepID=A0ABW4XRA8_9GAMM
MTVVNLSRRNLFRPDIKQSAPLRPPWSLAEADFTEACTRCGDCVNACPTNVIKVGSGGFPEIDFSQAECTFCDNCSTACPSDAINKQSEKSPWQYVAKIEQSCLSLQGVFCRSCGDVCEHRAIRFKLQVGGRASPELDIDACTGCGACVAPCPSQAIVIEEKL